LPPNTFSNVPATVPADSVNVLLMDALNTPMPDQSNVHKVMVKYLANIPPGIRIAVFLLSNRLRIIQGFTQDSSALRAAISRGAANPDQSALLQTAAENNMNQTAVSEAASVRPAAEAAASTASAAALQQFLDQQSNFQTNERVEMSLQALEQMARYLGGIPGRKNLIWFTSTIPLCLFATAEGDASPSGNANAKGDCPYYDRIKKTITMLTNAQISVYPIEAGGLLPDPINDASLPSITSAVSAGAPGTVYQAQMATQLQVDTMQNGTKDRNLTHTTMDQLARDTGGKAIYNVNGLKESLTEDIDNGARYYTISYTPTNLSEAGKERKIEVKLASGKYSLAYRRSYIEDTPKEQKAAEAAKVKDPLRPLMDRGMPDFTELHYRINLAPANPQPAPDAPRAGSNSALQAPFTRYGVNFLLSIDGLDITQAPDGVRRGKIEVALVAYSRDGKPLNWAVRFVGLAVKPEQYEMAQKSGIPFHVDIDAPPGDVYLRTGIYDMSSSRAGTLEIPLSAVTVTAQ
jgi:VWFA-related protein